MAAGVNGAAIRVESLHVVRGGKVVLPELTCTVASGAVTGLLGPSGSGKSTLIRAVVGVQRVAGGRVDGARRAGRLAAAPLAASAT